MNLLVHTGTRSGTNTPLLRKIQVRGSAFNDDTAARIGVSLKDYRNQLLPGTEMKSDYEKMFKGCFLELGLRVDYEPFSLFVGKSLGREIMYTPDFVTELKVGGRQVIIEPHGMKYFPTGYIESEITKLKMFRLVYKNDFYLIMVSDLAYELLKFRASNNPDGIIDEYWETPRSHREARENVMKRLGGLLLRVENSGTPITQSAIAITPANMQAIPTI